MKNLKAYNLRRSVVLASVVTALLGSGGAYAGATAYSELSVYNFKVFGVPAGGGPNVQLDVADFALNPGGAISGATETGNATATLGVTTDTGGTVNGTINLNAGTASSGGQVDPRLACVGTCGGLANNNFVDNSGLPLIGGNYIAADALKQGYSITGMTTPATITAGTGMPGSGSSTDVASTTNSQGALVGDATGNASSEINLNTTFEFILGSADRDLDLNAGPESRQIRFEFDADLFLSTAIDSAGQSAKAGSSMTFNLLANGVQVFTWLPGQFAFGPGVVSSTGGFSLTQTNISDIFSSSAPISSSGGFSLNVNVPVGVKLTGSITQNSSIELVSVPEPGGLALMGLGLLAAGVVSRKKLSA